MDIWLPSGLRYVPPGGGPLLLRDAWAYVDELLSPLGHEWRYGNGDQEVPDLEDDDELDDEDRALYAAQVERDHLHRQLQGLREVEGELEILLPHPDGKGGTTRTSMRVKSQKPRSTGVAYHDIYMAVATAVGQVTLAISQQPLS